MSNKIVTVPNAISLARICLIPVIFFCIVNWYDLAAVALLIVAGASDGLDGYIARRFNQVSKIGKILDPIADRFFIFFVLYAIYLRELIPLWFLLLVIMRELILLGMFSLVVLSKEKAPEVKYIGKVGAASLLVGMPLYFVISSIYSWGLLGAGSDGVLAVIVQICFILLCIGLILYYIAGAFYFKDAIILIRNAPKFNFILAITVTALIAIIFGYFIITSLISGFTV